MSVIEVSGLTKSYGSIDAVKGIDFSVDEGEVFTFLGPNGAGKTTTVEILEGFRSRSSGDVSVMGFDPGRGEIAMKSRMGIVLQSCGIQEELTVAEVLDLYGSYYPKRLEVDAVIDLVELGEKRDTRIKKLSGGQQRRVDLAVGLIGDPDLIFLDEPTTGFDPAARRNAWAMVKNLCALGKTVFLTTHYMDEAQELADRIAVISNGEIVASGTPDDIGGRAVAATVIKIPDASGLGDLPAFGGTVVKREPILEIETTSPTEILNKLTGWALERGIELRGMSVAQPSLEDVYLDLVGEAGDEPHEVESLRGEK